MKACNALQREMPGDSADFCGPLGFLRKPKNRRTKSGALFCYDSVFWYNIKGEVYLSNSDVNNVIWHRYLQAFDSLVVVARGRPLDPRATTAETKNFRDLPVSFVPIPNLSGPGALKHWAQVKAVLRCAIAQSDAVIVRVPSEIGLLAAKLAREMGWPVAMEVVADAWSSYWHHGRWAGKLYAPLMAWRVRQAVRQSDFTVYVSHYLQRDYPNGGEFTVLSNVALHEPNICVLRRRLRRIQRQRRPIVFGLIGNYHYRLKGVHIAIKSLGRVMRQLPDFELRVLGTGDSAPLAALAERKGLSGRVHFPNTLPGGEPVLRWLDDVDIYLQPSFTEGLPRALLEAMSRGCAAIGSAVGGVPELLEAECLHEPGDVGGLASLILRVTLDTEWRKAQAQRNFETANSYTTDALDPQRLAFWDSFARHARNGLLFEQKGGSLQDSA